jgi:hypothetical protein
MVSQDLSIEGFGTAAISRDAGEMLGTRARPIRLDKEAGTPLNVSLGEF